MSARLVVAAAAALGCAACGFKGPLYLPQQNAAVITHAPAGTRVAPALPAPARRKTGRQGSSSRNTTPN